MGTDSTQTGQAGPPSRHSMGPAVAAVPDPTPLRATSDRNADRNADRNLAPAEHGDRSGADASPGAWFAVVLRGYDRAQVDARLADLDRRIRDEIMRADGAEAALGAARAQVRRLEEAGTPATDEHGFGRRVERVLAAAEHEATEVREHAAREAETLLERAREDAERTRRQTEEALLGRAAKLDDEFAARSAALDAREREVDRVVERARLEADEIRAEAERSATDARSDAERVATDLRRAAEETIDRQRADATRDIGRMATLRDEVRHELTRLQEMLRGELEPGRSDPFDDATTATPTTPAPVAPSLSSVPTESYAAPIFTAPSGFDDTDTDAAGIGTADDARGRTDAEGSGVRTAIGAIPPYTVASIGVLPFGDRSAGGPANGRSFAFELVPDARSDGDDRSETDRGPTDGRDEARTSQNASDDEGTPDRNPTRSTLPTRGRR